MPFSVTLTNTKFPPLLISDNGIYVMRIIFNSASLCFYLGHIFTHCVELTLHIFILLF